MNIDVEFLRETVAARGDVVKWLNERPYTGLSVTDVETLVRGYDYLASIIRDMTGTDPTNFDTTQIKQPTIKITYGE